MSARMDQHHYVVERYGLDDRTIGRQCFDTSNGAIAYMVGLQNAPGTFKVFCVTGAMCAQCNPYLPVRG
jgi:hypothetical protein